MDNLMYSSQQPHVTDEAAEVLSCYWQVWDGPTRTVALMLVMRSLGLRHYSKWGGVPYFLANQNPIGAACVPPQSQGIKAAPFLTALGLGTGTWPMGSEGARGEGPLSCLWTLWLGDMPGRWETVWETACLSQE